MRVVSDILTFGQAPVAFIELTPNTETSVGTYKGVCPWCEADLQSVMARTFGDLYELLFTAMQMHMRSCPKGGLFEVQVKIGKPERPCRSPKVRAMTD